MALSKTTQDHGTIQKWAEARGAMPAEVASTARGKQTGILRFAFPKARNHKDENLNEISWDEFFEKFDQNGLELIYQEKTAGGARSNFNKLIYPEHEHASGRGKTSSSASGRSSGSRSSNSGSRSSGSGSRSASSGSSDGASKTRSISSGRSSSSSSGRGSTKSKGTATGRGSSSSRSSSSSGRSSGTSSRRKAA